MTTPTKAAAPDLGRIRELLRRLQASFQPLPGSHSAKMGGGPMLLNPHGPEAAALILEQQARIERLEGALGAAVECSDALCEKYGWVREPEAQEAYDKMCAALANEPGQGG